MRILILGGTAWLGRSIATDAIAHGHDVVCVARGLAGPVAEGATLVTADRDRPEALDFLSGERFDAVVDVARQPGQVRSAVVALAASTDRYVLISSISVYADPVTVGQDESAAVMEPLAHDALQSPSEYGAGKVACERHVQATFGATGSLIVRAGLIGGPGDETDRTGYWPLRFSRSLAADDAILVPDVADAMTQVIDVRDLAAWIVRSVADRRVGVFNVCGETIGLARHLELARTVAGSAGRLVAVSPQWLLDHDVKPWSGPHSLPLWLPMPDYAGFVSLRTDAAMDAGLQRRPLEETLRDTLAWERSRSPGERKAGLTQVEEERLLEWLAGR